MTKTRITTPDILKGISVILMIQVHLMELFATHEVYDSLIGKISLFLGGPPAAPVFMAVMGYFLARSQKDFHQQITRGLKLIGLGFLVNIGMNFHLLIRIIAGSGDQNPWPFVFGVDILFLAGISIILIALAQRIFKKRIVPYLIFILLVSIIGQFIPLYSGRHEWIKYIQALFNGGSQWSYFPIFPWLAYPLTGFLFSILDEKYNLAGITSKARSYIVTATFIMLVLTFHFGFKISGSLPLYYNHSLIFYFWVVVFLIFWVLFTGFTFDGLKKTFLTNYLVRVGKNVTAFYVIQWIIIGNLATIFYKSQDLTLLALWFAIIMTMTTLLALLWEKVKVMGLMKSGKLNSVQQNDKMAL